jgi:SPX domain protein involved in polyphosphate accumulation
MKFGEYLLSQRTPGWEEQYLNYHALKNLIKDLQDLNEYNNGDDAMGKLLSAHLRYLD